MLETFFVAIVGSALSGVVIVFLTKSWIETRLKESIKHEYDQKMALFKRELEEKQLERQKIALVSELIAEWMACPPDETLTKEYRTRINRLSFEASLWLPSETSDRIEQETAR